MKRWFADAPALPDPPLTRRDVNGVAICLAASALSHAVNIPLWTLAAGLAMGWLGWRGFGRAPLAKGLKIGLALAVVVAVVFTFQTFLGRDAGVTALVLLGGLKFTEIRAARDLFILCLLGFFLVMTQLLFHRGGFAFLGGVALTACWLALVLRFFAAGGTTGFRPWLRRAGGVLLHTLPFLAALFVLFPRSAGPIWNLGAGAVGRSGFSSTIDPGQIAAVALSSEPVMRVTFPQGRMPAMADLYFRGLVLWYTDGRAWIQGSWPSMWITPGNEPPPPGTTVQEILLEPHQNFWLFALDRPLSMPSWSRRMPGGVFIATTPVMRPVRYTAHSAMIDDQSPLSPLLRRWALQLPRRPSVELQELAASWVRGAENDAAVAAVGLEYFRRGGFVYTTEPGILNPHDPLADFLLRRRRGFCEHFAASYALMMRYCGVPARMVVGYQGGQYNDVGGYLLVRQSEAHAWCEVWLMGRGWVRIDPTAAVAPERLEMGGLFAPSATGGEMRRNPRERRQLDFWQRLGRRTGDYLDYAENLWNRWIIAYDSRVQLTLFKGLEFFGSRRLGLLLAAVLAVGLLFGVFWLGQRRRREGDPLRRHYDLLGRILARSGPRRHPWEGPLDYGGRAATAYPDRAGEITDLFDEYIRLRYGPDFPQRAVSLRQWCRRVKRLRLKTWPAGPARNAGKGP